MDLEERVKKVISYLSQMAETYVFARYNKGLLAELAKQEIFMLKLLGESGKTNMTDLAHRASVALSTVTGIVDKLVEKGFVTRERTEEDRRLVFVELTQKGRRAFQQDLEVRREMGMQRLSELDEGEQEELVRLLGKMAGKIGR